MSRKMEVVAITNDHKVGVKRTRRPDVEPGKILMHIKACALYTWEQRVFTRESKMPLPFVGGHEIVGSITTVGEEINERGFPIGRKPTARLIQVCGKCYFCRHGKKNLYVDTNTPFDEEMEILDTGGLGEYLNIDPSQAYLLPESLSDTAAVFNEPLACVLNSVERGQITLEDGVVVLGGGIMGMLHILCIKLSGARVIMNEPDAERRALAKTLGCDDTINPMRTNPVDYIKNPNGIGTEAVFNIAPISATAKQTVEVTAPLGRCVVYSSQHPGKPIEISPNWLRSSGAVITGAVSPNVRSFQRAVSMLSRGLIDLEKLVPGVYPCNQAQKAFETAVRPDTFRIIITF